MAPHDLARERAPLPVPAVCSRVAPRYEPSGRPARQALTCSGALGADWRGRSSSDGGARPRPSACPGRAANTAVLAEGARLLINDPDRFEGVRVIGVDEHVWRHTPHQDRYVTVILDLTPVRDRRGPSRLLDMVPGRSKRVFKTWLASQPDTWRENIEIVAMDGFTGFKSAAAEELPDARAVMDPFHVVHLAGNALDECRRRIQQELHHRRGRSTDPLYKARKMLHTRSCLLTPRQQHQLLNLFSGEEHVALEVTWSAYQNIIDAYRDPNKICGKALMEAEINTLTCHACTEGSERAHHAGQDTQTPSRGHPGLLRPPPHQQWPYRSDQRPPRTPTRLRPRVPKPHQLHHPSTPRNRRIQTPTTPPIMKSLETYPLEVQLSSHTVFQVKYNYARFTDLSKTPELIAANRIPVENI